MAHRGATRFLSFILNNHSKESDHSCTRVTCYYRPASRCSLCFGDYWCVWWWKEFLKTQLSKISFKGVVVPEFHHVPYIYSFNFTPSCYRLKCQSKISQQNEEDANETFHPRDKDGVTKDATWRCVLCHSTTLNNLFILCNNWVKSKNNTKCRSFSIVLFSKKNSLNKKSQKASMQWTHLRGTLMQEEG